MSVTKSEYQSVEFKAPARVYPGRIKANNVDAVKGIRLVRLTGDGKDDLIVGGPGVTPHLEIPWTNVASATRLPPPPKEPEPPKGESKKDEMLDRLVGKDRK